MGIERPFNRNPLRSTFLQSVGIMMIFYGFQLSSTTVINWSPDSCSNSHCRCINDTDYLNVECSYDEFKSNISIIKYNIRSLRIECNYVEVGGHKLETSVQPDFINKISLAQCPLQQKSSVKKILDSMGIALEFNLSVLLNIQRNIMLYELASMQFFESLTLTSNTSLFVPRDLLFDVKNIQKLTLRVKDLQLEPSAFTTFENLNHLDISNCNLTDLPSDAFHDQHKITNFIMDFNLLRNLSKDTFRNTPSVKELSLSSNEIETFPPDIFSLLPNLEYIDLSNNVYREIPENLFEHNKNLKEVYLSTYKKSLASIPPRLFSSLPNFTIVYISCKLSTLPNELFSNLLEMTNIIITDNELRRISGDFLIDQKKLYYLNLNGNRLQSLPEELLFNTIQLMEVNLSNNELTELPRNIFSNLTRLEQLYLENNRIQHIDFNIFRRTANLQILNLANNRIFYPGYVEKEVATSISVIYLMKLRILNLRNNTISHFFGRNFKSLEDIDLSYNKITNLNFKHLDELSFKRSVINLEYNHITNIDFHGMKNFKREKFEKVLLNGNPIQCDCKLSEFVNTLQHNSKTFATEQLKCDSPPNLEGKLVRDRLVDELWCPVDLNPCPASCRCFTNTITLMVNCTNMNLTEVPEISGTDELGVQEVVLHLENNKIKHLPSNSGGGYENVTELHLAENNLTRIDFGNLPPRISFLDLRKNNFRNLDEGVLDYLNKTHTKLSLSANPWDCNCEDSNLKSFLQFTKFNSYRIQDLKQMHCSSPHNSTSFQYLSIHDICPTPLSLILIVCVSVSVVGFIIGITLAFYYKYQQEIKVWLYAHGLFLWLITEDELDKDKEYDGFVSYSHKDSKFVEDQLMKELECGPIPFKLCIHERDWVIGETIPTQIMTSVEHSRRTIVVLSKNFIESVWGRMEFRAAHQSALNEKRNRVIIIIYGDIGDIESLESELKAYLKTNTYVRWGDPWFWDKLRYAMPHRTRKHPKRNLFVKFSKSREKLQNTPDEYFIEKMDRNIIN